MFYICASYACQRKGKGKAMEEAQVQAVLEDLVVDLMADLEAVVTVELGAPLSQEPVRSRQAISRGQTEQVTNPATTGARVITAKDTVGIRAVTASPLIPVVTLNRLCTSGYSCA